MQIVYVTETYPPEVNGVALTTARTVAHLRAAGHPVHLVRPRQRGEAARDDADEWRCAGAPIPMYPELRWGLATRAALRRRWRRIAPALVHVATPGPLAHAALAAARAEGIPTSADFRTNFHAYGRHYGLGWLEPLVMAWLRRLHERADCSFVPTAALAAELAAAGFRRLAVSGRGVDARRFDPARRDDRLRAAWGAAAADPVLLHVGRLAAEKNVALALRCWERLRAARPGLRMVVVGDGPQRPSLQRRHPEACFVGQRTGEELARHYASADAFAFPSLTDTFGNVTLEALASGLALAAFDTAAAAVHVVDGDNGCLAPPGDEAGFEAALARALAQARPGSALRRRARESAVAADWPLVLQRFEQVLCAVAERRGAGRLGDAAPA
ncbi:glycosyltransferase [Rubrivivax sp. JA1026]|uniref:glycosyltransferase n=1 Tax=Rubrivivax sp. JA1026 TaxID=2710888 RepID=UPI0013E968C1|nr:glycosyltransferase [Rubrivivax sp. JA1026]